MCRTVRAMVVSHGAGPLDVRKARRIQSVANSTERKIALRRAPLKTRHVFSLCTMLEKKGAPDRTRLGNLTPNPFP